MRNVIASPPVPGYCTSGHGILTPGQWQTCWNLGWRQPVNTTVTRIGSAVGTGIGIGAAASAAIIICAVLFLLVVVLRKAATSN